MSACSSPPKTTSNITIAVSLWSQHSKKKKKAIARTVVKILPGTLFQESSLAALVHSQTKKC